MLNKEANILGTIFKKKTHQVGFDERAKKKALEFGKEYWDDPSYPGYAGYYYDGRWEEPAKSLLSFFNIKNKSTIVDICCGKGFMLYEMYKMYPALDLRGVDISQYAIDNAKEEIRDRIMLAKAEDLPFPDKSIDLTYSLNSLYMLPLEYCKKAILEMERVGKNSFIQVMSYRNERERKNLLRWDCTAQVVMSTEEWRVFFKKIGYTGFYYWNVFL